MTRINVSTYEAFLAFLKQQRLEQLDSLAKIEESITQIESTIAEQKSVDRPLARTQDYAHFKHLADAAKAYLISVGGAWRKTSVIAKALLDGGFPSKSKTFRANVETALQRRLQSPVAPDKELEKGPRGWRHQPSTRAA